MLNCGIMLLMRHNFLLSFSYKLLHVLEFDSTRKRMSVIVSEADGKRYCTTTRGEGVLLFILYIDIGGKGKDLSKGSTNVTTAWIYQSTFALLAPNHAAACYITLLLYIKPWVNDGTDLLYKLCVFN